MPAPARAAERAPAPAPTTQTRSVPSKGGAPPSTALANAPPTVTLGAALAPDEVNLAGGQLTVSNADDVKEGESVEVKTRLPGLAEGTIKVWKNKGAFNTRGNGVGILLVHPILARLSTPTVLVVSVKDNVIGGYVSLGAPGAARGKDRAIFNAIGKGADALGWLGLTNLALPTGTNELVNGQITLAVQGMRFKVGGFLDGSGSFSIVGRDLSLEGSAAITVPGGVGGNLVIKRDPKGVLSGSASIAVNVGGVTGTVAGDLTDGFVSIMGTVAYSGDKLNGSITLLATDEATARDLTLQKPQAGGGVPHLDAGAAKTNKPGKRAFCGFGEVSFQINDWLAGSAMVIVNSKGQATIIGEIAPPKEFILFEQKDWEKTLFKVEARGGYGIPVVGQVFVFASAELKAKASVGPGKLYNIKLAGVYSTDPRVTQEMTLEASLNISAFAGLIVRAEGGVGITILGHDIKAGVGIDATAGVRGYVEATPKIGMRKAPGQKTQYFIEGHMEIAAQPFLGLGGDLFVSIETPWWSPLSDKRWTWPLFSLEYPLPGEFGIGADVSYLLGSKKWPEISFGDVDFDASKFTTDIMGDNAPKGSGGEKKKPGKWKEGAGGAAPGVGAGGGGKAGKGKGDEDGFSGPIGEPMTFSDGQESHRLWVEEKGSAATVSVASENPGPIAARLKTSATTLLGLAAPDQKKARGLIAKAEHQLAKADKDVHHAAVLKAAAKNARDTYAREGSAKKKGRAKKSSGDVKKDVSADERALVETLTTLFRLLVEIPFKPIDTHVEMWGGGQEDVSIVAKGATPALTIGQRDGKAALLRVATGPVGLAKNKRGAQFVEHVITVVGDASKHLTPVHLRNGRVLKAVYDPLPQVLTAPARELRQLGLRMRVKGLARAAYIGPIPKDRIKHPTLLFKANPKAPEGSDKPNDYPDAFLKEMKRQLGFQEEGLNSLTVDAWVRNLQLFSMDAQRFSKLDHSARFELLAEVNKRAAEALAGTHRHIARVQAQLGKLDKALASSTETIAGLELELKNAKDLELKNAREIELKKAELKNAKDLELRAARELELQNAQAKVVRVETAQSEIAAKKQLNEQGYAAAPRRDLLDAPRPKEPDERWTRRYQDKILGRLGGERSLGARLRKDKLNLLANTSEWQLLATEQKDIVVLHNPDQMAGGYDRWPPLPRRPRVPEGHPAWKTYWGQIRRFVGPQVVNETISRSWKAQLKIAYPEVVKAVQQEGYGIYHLNFSLVRST